MNANAAKTWLCLFVFMLLPIAASAAGLKEDMVALDRAFIPAFGTLNRTPPQPEDAKRAMAALDAQWAAWAYYGMIPVSAQHIFAWVAVGFDIAASAGWRAPGNAQPPL